MTQGARREAMMITADKKAFANTAGNDGRKAATLELVREALDHKRGLLAYQPIVASQHVSTPAFYEALIRIYNRQGQLIPAREFMGEVEDSSIGREIDCLTLDLALQTLTEQQDLRLSINMSARSIGYRRWIDRLNKGLSEDPMIGERLVLEITESSAMLLPELVTSFMKECQTNGISFALDDFGAGYTSFRYLRQFSFDIVKIDGQFIRSVHTDSNNQTLVQALTMIAQQFDMLTVAESVETEQEMRCAIDLGVDCLQGYYFGAPTIYPPWLREDEGDKVAG